MAAPKRNREIPTDRALQYSDLDREGQGAARNIMRDQGAIKSRLGERKAPPGPTLTQEKLF